MCVFRRCVFCVLKCVDILPILSEHAHKAHMSMCDVLQEAFRTKHGGTWLCQLWLSVIWQSSVRDDWGVNYCCCVSVETREDPRRDCGRTRVVNMLPVTWRSFPGTKVNHCDYRVPPL